MSKSALKTDLYGKKFEAYSTSIRWEIIELIPTGDHKILDVGCGAGQTLKKLKELGKANEIVGIEIDEQVTRDLSGTLDRLYVGDVETMDLPYTEKYFDYILFGDVLEHLINPRRVLHSYRKLIKDDGFIIASIPNIKYYSVVLRLLFYDEFQYTDAGILDSSHLRFFTKKEIINMFKEENFEVDDLIPVYVEGTPPKRYNSRLFTYLSNRLFLCLSRLHILAMYFLDSSFYAYQYIIKAKKKGPEEATINSHL